MKQRHHTLLILLAMAATLLIPAQAMSFCGFYVGGADTKLFNNATMVVMMREGTKTVLSMQNNYEGPPENFAMVVPVPVVLKKENVKTLKHQLFDKVDKMASPRLVEYFERDPCYRPRPRKTMAMNESAAPSTRSVRRKRSAKSLGVKIEAQFDVAEYNVVVLSAKESNGLETWLKQEKYNIPKGAAPALKPYIQNGMYFFVAKVDIKKVKKEKIEGKERAVLSPLRFHYDAKTFSLPIRLGLLNANGKQDLIVHILAKNQRYEVANKKNVTIPTNLIVKKSIKKRFGEFYANLFDYTLEENPGAVVTEYSWAASTCDPCPGPTLNGSDFYSLGADIINANPAGLENIKSPMPRRRFRGRRRPSWRRAGWVLTRLHARYSAKDIKDDLVFKKADPIIGGRGTPVGLEGKLKEEGSKTSSYNNFQGRYIILNPWEGAMDCKNPRRGIWGGPTRGAKRQTFTAQNTAFSPRGKLQLPAVIAQESVPGLKNIKPTGKLDFNKAGSKPPESKPPVKSETPKEKPTDSAPKASPKAAGCAQTDGSPIHAVWMLLGLMVFGWRRRRA